MESIKVHKFLLQFKAFFLREEETGAFLFSSHKQNLVDDIIFYL